MERIYGGQGSAGNYGTRRHTSDTNNFGGKQQSDLAENIGISDEQLRNYKKLLTLIPELQSLIETGEMNHTMK